MDALYCYYIWLIGMVNWNYRSSFRVQDEKKGKFKWFYRGHHYSLWHTASVTPRHMTGCSLTNVDDGADLPVNVIMSTLLLPSSSKKLSDFELLTPWRWMQQVPKMRVTIFWLTWSYTLADLNLDITIN